MLCGERGESWPSNSGGDYRSTDDGLDCCRHLLFVIRVRTTYREPEEQVYIYRIKGSRENLRPIFLD